MVAILWTSSILSTWDPWAMIALVLWGGTLSSYSRITCCLEGQFKDFWVFLFISIFTKKKILQIELLYSLNSDSEAISHWILQFHYQIDFYAYICYQKQKIHDRIRTEKQLAV